MAKNIEFAWRYEQWQRDCLDEYNERFCENREYCEPPEHDVDPGLIVEFGEDGSAYPHGIGGTSHIPDAVKPWRESEWFVAR